MPNNLQYASVFPSDLDTAAVEQATSGWMEPNSSLIRYNGGKTVKVPQIVMYGLADYDNGFVDGDVTLTWQDLTFAMDRGRRFSLDAVSYTHLAVPIPESIKYEDWYDDYVAHTQRPPRRRK